MTKRAYGLPFVISAASAGTIVEWYDFYLYATLTPFLSPLFFPGTNPTAVQLSGFAAYAAGFLVRPFGAVVFGALGDIIGRKYTFLVTITAMGLATLAMGLLPTYKDIGLAAPALFVLLRLIQGLALGGEYGGAAIYVAEHAPDNKRGLYTSWIQTTATIGFFAALGIILLFRNSMSAADFSAQGWRYPFWFSGVLVVFAFYIRLRLRETPLFARLKEQKKIVTGAGNWAEESFSGRKVGTILLWAIGLGTPFFLVFGWLSDKIGRKVIILAGCLIAAITYVPIYHAMYDAANVTLGPAGLITKADPNVPVMIFLVWIQIIFVTMVYGPIAAFLVEYFRAKVRYTSLSIPYHFGNGWFGGLLPLLFIGLGRAHYSAR